jgi:hypothetical protein
MQMSIGKALIAVPLLRKAGVQGIDEFEARCCEAGGSLAKMVLPRTLIASLARANVDRYQRDSSAFAAITSYLGKSQYRSHDAISCDALLRACRRMPAHWPTMAAVRAILGHAIRNGGEIGARFETFLRDADRSVVGAVYAPDTRRAVVRAAISIPLLAMSAVCIARTSILPGAIGGPAVRAIFAVSSTETVNVIAAAFACSPIAERGHARWFAWWCFAVGSICAILVKSKVPARLA